MLGITLVIIGLIILIVSLWTLKDMTLSFLATFTSSVIIMLGGVIMVSIPIKAFLKSIIVLGLWTFLFLLPLFLLPLPPEVPPLAGSFSLLFLALIFVYYEKRNAKKHGKSVEK
jgi:hypothetical protein